MVQRFRDGRNTAVDIATRYGMDGPGFEPRWGWRDFRTRPDRSPGPPSLLYNGYRVSFSGVKRPGRCANSAEVKNEWCYTSTSPLSLLGMLRDSFIVWKLLGGGLRNLFGSDKTWQIPRGTERVCGKMYVKIKLPFLGNVGILLLLLLLLLFTAVEFSLGHSSPYTSNK